MIAKDLLAMLQNMSEADLEKEVVVNTWDESEGTFTVKGFHCTSVTDLPGQTALAEGEKVLVIYW